MQSDDDYLKNLYYDIKSPAAYGGVDKLHRVVKERNEKRLSKGKIEKWLQKQPIYTANRHLVRKFPRRKVVIPYIGYMYDIDNAYMNDYSKDNDGYKYFLLVIDDFSRYVWTRPIKQLTGENIVQALKSILDDSKIPEKIRSDKGSEFANKDVNKFLKTKNIDHVLTQNETKASFAERAIAVIKGRLLKHMIRNKSKRWIDVLQDATDAYNSSFHRTIQMKPKDVTKKDEADLWNLMYLPAKIEQKIKKETKSSVKRRRRRNPFRFKVGDFVNIALNRSKFGRLYDKRWSDEYFTVAERSIKQGIPVFSLKDINNEPILGTFYSRELQKVSPQQDQTYEIERVLKRRTRQGQKEALVRWAGWGKAFDSWIPADSINNYK